MRLLIWFLFRCAHLSDPGFTLFRLSYISVAFFPTTTTLRIFLRLFFLDDHYTFFVSLYSYMLAAVGAFSAFGPVSLSGSVCTFLHTSAHGRVLSDLERSSAHLLYRFLAGSCLP